MKITIEEDGKEPEIIETGQFFVMSEKGCSYSGSYDFLIGKLYFKLKEIEKQYGNS